MAEQTLTIKIPTREQIEVAIANAYAAIKSASDKAAQTSTSEKIASALTKYSADIQNIVNSFLSQKGIITQEQLNQLDEKVRETKKKTLEAESKNTLVRFGIYTSAAVVVFGFFWILTREKK